ncbi:uncharacterized protein LOC100162938 [Acyrthosiphon pisum]|uniref:ACYPI004057 protein n=1 Tax=Acyrthosiphon pisum TaxID=7029 RepID=C4WUB8_ACYPI|nr:uncharacterized protein LOC100162938 [Acyrthosiphon pisum]BAH71488.1 ACYPI004057 [Acyrthosiphon pisum]|eukprot:NP_001233016.1 uncharacterized protein LOC100162938 [Acyrthosiphon pisum]
MSITMYSTILCKKFLSGSLLHDLSRSQNVDAISALSNSFIAAKFFSHNTTCIGVQPHQQSFLRPGPNRITYLTSIDVHRYYCNKNYRPFPEVPEFPPIVWPNVFKSLKALIYSYLIIKPQLDKDFSLGEFAKNSRKAVEVVSNCISKRDFTTLQGLVTNDVLEQVKSIVSDLNDNEIKDMAFDNDDMYLFLPVQLDIINDTKLKDRRFVEITMCYHAIHNLEEIKKRSEEIVDIQKELKSNIFVLNYRFIREYTEGVKDAWTINAINHLKAEEHDKTIL